MRSRVSSKSALVSQTLSATVWSCGWVIAIAPRYRQKAFDASDYVRSILAVAGTILLPPYDALCALSHAVRG